MFPNQDLQGLEECGKRSTPAIEKPETLCRIVYNLDSRYNIRNMFDNDDYLLPHSKNERNHEVLGVNNRVLSMVHPDEWETIARIFGITGGLGWGEPHGNFSVLTIDTSKIETLSRQPHFLLLYGEYYGLIHKRGIIKKDDYIWEKSDKKLNVLQEILSRFQFKFERSLGYTPKLVSSQSPFL